MSLNVQSVCEDRHCPCALSLTGIKHIPLRAAFPAFLTILKDFYKASDVVWILKTVANQNVGLGIKKNKTVQSNIKWDTWPPNSQTVSGYKGMSAAVCGPSTLSEVVTRAYISQCFCLCVKGQRLKWAHIINTYVLMLNCALCNCQDGRRASQCRWKRNGEAQQPC